MGKNKRSKSKSADELIQLHAIPKDLRKPPSSKEGLALVDAKRNVASFFGIAVEQFLKRHNTGFLDLNLEADQQTEQMRKLLYTLFRIGQIEIVSRVPLRKTSSIKVLHQCRVRNMLALTDHNLSPTTQPEMLIYSRDIFDPFIIPRNQESGLSLGLSHNMFLKLPLSRNSAESLIHIQKRIKKLEANTSDSGLRQAWADLADVIGWIAFSLPQDIPSRKKADPNRRDYVSSSHRDYVNEVARADEELHGCRDVFVGHPNRINKDLREAKTRTHSRRKAGLDRSQRPKASPPPKP